MPVDRGAAAFFRIHSEIFQEGGKQVRVLGQAGYPFSGTEIFRHMYQKGDSAHFIPGMVSVFAGHAVFAQHMSMIRSEYDTGIFPQILPVRLIQKLTQPFIRHGQRGIILVSEMGNSFRGFFAVQGGISGPFIKTGEIIGIHSLEFFGSVKRLMRIKGFYRQEKMIFSFIIFQPLYR